MKNYVNEEGSRLLKFAFPLVDKNGGGKIFMDEFLMNTEWKNDILFKIIGCRGENCFNPKPFPMPSENLNFGASEEIPCFFPQFSSITIACKDRLKHLETAFLLSCLDSPMFFNEKKIRTAISAGNDTAMRHRNISFSCGTAIICLPRHSIQATALLSPTRFPSNPRPACLSSLALSISVSHNCTAA